MRLPHVRRTRRFAVVTSLLALALVSQVISASSSAAAEQVISTNKPVLTSSNEDSTLTGPKAVDGSTSTRWASAEGSDPQWIRIDLGASAAITRVKLNWEAAYAKAYTLQVSNDGTAWSTVKSVTAGDGGIDDHTGLTAQGRYVRMHGTQRATPYGYSLWEFEVYGAGAAPSDPLISRDKATSASSNEDGTLTPDKAVDGNTSTRWASAEGSDPQWIRIDLGASAAITRVKLNWEAAYAKAYTLQVSNDGTAWSTVKSVTAGDGGIDDHTGLTAQGRYVRMHGTQRATPYGYSLWEFEVYGTGGAPNDPGFTVAATGDIAGACSASDGTACEHERTARLVESINPKWVLTTGDNQYDDGKISEFRSYFDTTWGRFKNKIKPTPGNHEYYDPAGGAAGYKQYFGSIAMPNGKTYYSYDEGNWHFIALDSGISMSATSSQVTWLKNDLAANTKKCVAAYWHHPLFNSGSKGYNPTSLPVWRELYRAKADLVLNGHDHVYERFTPQNPDAGSDSNGMVAITVGLGGAYNYTFEGSPEPNSVVRLTDLHGVVTLNLTDSGFSGQLVDDSGRVRDTIPSYSCH